MHEAALCLRLVDLAEAQLDRAQAAVALALEVEVGELSGVVPEALRSAFPICARGTRAEGAEIRIVRTAGRELILREMEVR